MKSKHNIKRLNVIQNKEPLVELDLDSLNRVQRRFMLKEIRQNKQHMKDFEALENLPTKDLNPYKDQPNKPYTKR